MYVVNLSQWGFTEWIKDLIRSFFSFFYFWFKMVGVSSFRRAMHKLMLDGYSKTEAYEKTKMYCDLNKKGMPLPDIFKKEVQNGKNEI